MHTAITNPKSFKSKLWILSFMIALAAFMLNIASGRVYANTTLTGSGTEEEPFEISSAEDLSQMIDGVNSGEFADKFFVLTEDITFNSSDFNEEGAFYNDGKCILPTGSQTTPFAGSFNGQGHKITGFKQRLTADDGNYGGLFGYAENATIKNLTMESVNINNTGTDACVGGVVGYMKNGTLEGCKVLSGSVSSGKTAGGITGCLNMSNGITGFENGAAVSGATQSGGIVGLQGSSSSITISHMKNTGSINGGIAGGIIGNGSSYGTTKITNSHNSGAVTGTNYAGGIVGIGGTATDCENTGKIKGDVAGGIGAGSTSTANSSRQCVVSKCSNKGEVSGSSYVAGINGYTGDVSECYNTGKINCTSSSGKAMGIGYGGYKDVTNCYNTGKVTSEGAAYGISGDGTGCAKTSYNIGVIIGKSGSYAISTSTVVTNCYYLQNRGTGKGTPLTAEQMELQDSFNGFSFSDKWTMAGIEEYMFPELISVEMTTDEIPAVTQIKDAAALNAAIDALSDGVTLEDEEAVIAARAAYETFISTYGQEAAGDITNYSTLEAAEETIEELNYAAAHDLKNASVSAIEDVVYTGFEIKPEPEVAIGDKVLQKNADYTLEYSDNLNVGTAIITIEGTGEYTGEKTIEFKIIEKSIEGAVITLTETSYVYDGTAKEPAVSVAFNGESPIDEAYYDVNYTNNISIGRATVVVTFKGNYFGQLETDFVIEAPVPEVDVSNAVVTLSKALFIYNGKVQKPSVIVTYANKHLSEGTDYILDWGSKAPVNAGIYTIQVIGQGRCAGLAKVTFRITKAANTLKVKAKSISLKASAVKKKKRSIKNKKAFAISKSAGKVTYKVAKYDKKAKKKIIVSKTGKITVKKGLKKGKYKVKVKVSAAGNANYMPLTKTVTVRIKIK